jgi:hypothetical protein
MGVDVLFPREAKVVKTCCCTGRGQFHRVEGRWSFEKWSGMICG